MSSETGRIQGNNDATTKIKIYKRCNAKRYMYSLKSVIPFVISAEGGDDGKNTYIGTIKIGAERIITADGDTFSPLRVLLRKLKYVSNHSTNIDVAVGGVADELIKIDTLTLDDSNVINTGGVATHYYNGSFKLLGITRGQTVYSLLKTDLTYGVELDISDGMSTITNNNVNDIETLELTLTLTPPYDKENSEDYAITGVMLCLDTELSQSNFSTELFNITTDIEISSTPEDRPAVVDGANTT